MQRKDAAYYRSRAEELRAKAADERDDGARNIILGTAAQCEQLAKAMEGGIGAKPPAKKP